MILINFYLIIDTTNLPFKISLLENATLIKLSSIKPGEMKSLSPDTWTNKKLLRTLRALVLILTY